MLNTDTQGPSPSFLGQLSLTGTGSKVICNNNTIGFTTINNASAFVNISNNLSCAPIILTAGSLFCARQTVYSATGTGNAITVASGSVISMDSITTLTPTNTIARINIASGSLYSITNCLIDNTNSVLAGTIIPQVASFNALKVIGNITTTSATISGLTASQLVATDASKNLQTLAVATYPSLTELSYVKGGTSSLQAQINALTAMIGGTTPSIGDYKQSAQTTSHNKYLLCNGAEISRSTYHLLFDVIGTSFGSTGVGTFTLPSPMGRVLGVIGSGAGLTTRVLGDSVGTETHLLTAAQSGSPAHEHVINGGNSGGNGPGTGYTWIFTNTTTGSWAVFTTAAGGNASTFLDIVPNTAANASQAHPNMQPTLFIGNLFIYAGV